MDANQTRFHLLLGKADWSRCLLSGKGREEIFSANSPVAWAERDELTLRPKPFYFPSAARNVSPEQSERRGAAADTYLNWYWIAQSGEEIRVHSSGEQSSAHFWSAVDAAVAPPPKSEIFQPITRPAPPCVCAFSGLAITEDNYLVVGAVKPKGLLVFDLLGGGAPRTICWPEEIDFKPFDIVPRRGGGVWILDRENKRFWGLDRGLRVITRDQTTSVLTAAEDEIFLPATETHHARLARSFPRGVELESGSPVEAVDPVAIEMLADGSILILDTPAASPPLPSRVLRYRFGKSVETAPLEFAAYDFAFAGGKLSIASAEGNQAFAFTLGDLAGSLTLKRSDEFFPLRRFGGKALVAAGDHVFYDFGERWLPVTVQAHPRHVEEATIETQAFDGREPQCVWHRLMLDACLPAGTAVEIWSRAADRESELAITPWEPEPSLHRRADGSELPFAPAPASRDRGTYELLLQKTRGRYGQLRLRLVGDGRVTPRLTALRVYYPRFSYLERYLPAVYREDAASASFLDRFLANLEGTNTAIEDRIAAAQMLFDVRSAPPDALEWLASWFGVALDPAWDETRRRLFIAHAMEFFQWRGTVRGLKVSLRLALEEQVDDHIFDPPGSACRCAERYRIVEKFLTRGIPAVEAGDPTQVASGPLLAAVGGKWSPQHGAAALHQQYHQATGGTIFSFTPIADDPNAEAARIAFAQRALGFVPSDPTEELAAWRTQAQDPEVELPEDEPASAEVRRSWSAFQISSAAQPFGRQRRLWQDFLVRRYVSLAALNQAHATHWQDFGAVAYPGSVPKNPALLFDWLEFETHVLPMLGAAHRFTVLLPVTRISAANDADRRRELALANRIVELEKPAHTAFEVRFFWANFRVGEARLGSDTVLGLGGRDPALLPRDTILGESYLSESLITPGPPPSLTGRIVVGRDRLNRKPTHTK